MSQRPYYVMINALPLGGLLLDGSGTIVAANERVAHIAGRERQSLIGEPFFEVFGFLPAVAEAEAGFRKGIYRGSLSARTVTDVRAASPADPVGLVFHFRSVEEEVPPRVLVVIDEMFEDESPRLHADQLENRLGEARAVKHEMSNVLMGLMGHAELLEAYPELSDKSVEKVRMIREQGRRLQEQLGRLGKICKGDD